MPIIKATAFVITPPKAEETKPDKEEENHEPGLLSSSKPESETPESAAPGHPEYHQLALDSVWGWITIHLFCCWIQFILYYNIYG